MTDRSPVESNSEPAFPPPVVLPDAVSAARADRLARVTRSATFGIGVRSTVIVTELVGYTILGHAVLLVDGMASLADIVASLAIVVAIRIAEKPPDDDHPFGHGKLEPLVGFQLGVFIIGLGAVLGAKQLLDAVQEPPDESISWWTALIPFTSAILLELTGQRVLAIGRRESCAALVAEAYHYRIDALTSLIAAAGLIMASWTSDFGHILDHLAALLLAVVMIWLGIVAARTNLHELLDRAPEDECFELVRRSAEDVSGVRAVEKVRIQRAGPDAHVDIDIEVDPRATVEKAHEIAQATRASIQTAWPAVREVVVHVEPFFDGDH